MSDNTAIDQFRRNLVSSLYDRSFLKLSLGNYNGDEVDLKNVYVRRIEIKKIEKLSFTYRYKTRDIVKNYDIEDAIGRIEQFLRSGFRVSTLFTDTEDVVIQQNQAGIYRLNRNVPALKTSDAISVHDKLKARILQPKGRPYLHQLGITDLEGKVIDAAQDKFKQINQYIELLSPMIKSVTNGLNESGSGIRHVVDMGSGKGYLTFALYDYLTSVLNLCVDVTGVEFREDLVTLCNNISKDSGFTDLNFVKGTIEDYNVEAIDLLVALHACDTATDDAIAKGIKAAAKLVVVAPCCHKQIRKEITKGKAKNELDFLTQHGIFLERQAEMVTDGMRALIMEFFGYKTKAMQFISDVHTPKNVMLVGVKSKITKEQQLEVLRKIQQTKSYFGIGYHHLERLMNLEAEYAKLS
jgi:SAM-dependent methyltransferase